MRSPLTPTYLQVIPDIAVMFALVREVPLDEAHGNLETRVAAQCEKCFQFLVCRFYHFAVLQSLYRDALRRGGSFWRGSWRPSRFLGARLRLESRLYRGLAFCHFAV